MAVFSVITFVIFQPKLVNSRILCAITGIMGLMAILSGPAGIKVQVLQLFLQLTVCFCCFVQLRRERRFRARRAARMHAHRQNSRQEHRMEPCA